MSPWNPYHRLAPTVFLASCLFTAQLRAQGPEDSPGGGFSHGMRDPDGSQRIALDPVLLDGPPGPADFAAITSPDSAQFERYQSLYTNFMATTQDDRDSLRATHTAMHAARQAQDHESMRRSAAASQELVVALLSSQKAFDDVLKAMLTGDQFKRYEGWRQERRKKAEGQMNARMQGRSGEPASP